MMHANDMNVMPSRGRYLRSCDVSFGAIFASPKPESEAMAESEMLMSTEIRIALAAVASTLAVVAIYLLCLFVGSNPVPL